jgi:hypothetical protein
VRSEYNENDILCDHAGPWSQIEAYDFSNHVDRFWNGAVQKLVECIMWQFKSGDGDLREERLTAQHCEVKNSKVDIAFKRAFGMAFEARRERHLVAA